jgi:hypothetical protein
MAGFIKASSEDRFQFIFCTYYREVSSEIAGNTWRGKTKVFKRRSKAQELIEFLCVHLSAESYKIVFPNGAEMDLDGEVGGVDAWGRKKIAKLKIRCRRILASIYSSEDGSPALYLP